MSTAPETQPAPRSRGRRFAIVFFSCLLAVLVAVGAVGYWYLNRISGAIDNNMRHETSMMPTEPEVLPTGPGKPTGPQTPKAKAGQAAPLAFVLMGTDVYTGASRSDALMVAYLSGDRKDAYLVSFPRDMWVSIPGHGKGKINAAYAHGGTALSVQTLEGLLGVKMSHAAKVDFANFIELTRVMGGVTVENRIASNDGTYSFPAGPITISGEQALAYVRQRKELPRGDLDRAERQRAVVKAIMDKLFSSGTLNPARFGETVDALARCITVDEGLTPDTVRSIATSVRITSGANIHSAQAPLIGLGTSPDGQSIDEVDQNGVESLGQAMVDDTMDEWMATQKP